MLQEAQIAHLTSTSFINRIDDKLTVISELRVAENAQTLSGDSFVRLYLNVFYDGEKMTVLSFNLINHSYDELIHVAQNVKENAFMLKEIDDYLSGDIE